MLNKAFGKIIRLLLIMPVLIVLLCSDCSAADPAEKHILIIHPYTTDFPGHVLFNRG
ncbi:MAG: hypothetical protein HQK56_19085 [Deltaproteobacteria bacterium]|nr:hypothetical protein [Deltaproteobacteria bacterium]